MTLKQGITCYNTATSGLRSAAYEEREGDRVGADIMRAWSAFHFREAARHFKAAPLEFREMFPTTAALWK
jgi:hypothetical protein